MHDKGGDVLVVARGQGVVAAQRVLELVAARRRVPCALSRRLCAPGHHDVVKAVGRAPHTALARVRMRVGVLMMSVSMFTLLLLLLLLLAALLHQCLFECCNLLLCQWWLHIRSSRRNITILDGRS